MTSECAWRVPFINGLSCCMGGVAVLAVSAGAGIEAQTEWLPRAMGSFMDENLVLWVFIWFVHEYFWITFLPLLSERFFWWGVYRNCGSNWYLILCILSFSGIRRLNNKNTSLSGLWFCQLGELSLGLESTGSIPCLEETATEMKL